MQHGVRIEAVFASLQEGEHMVESTCFQHTSSHPDKYNNSVDRIISKEEEREDPRRELQSIFEYSGVPTFLQELQDLFEYSVFYSVSTCNPASFQSSHAKKTILHTELIPLHEISKKYYNYKAHPVQINTRHLPATVPVHPSILHGRIQP